jgi:hypothetical protein
LRIELEVLKWKSEVEMVGVTVESLMLGTIKDLYVEGATPNEIYDGIRDEMMFTVNSFEIWNFFEKTFSNDDLIHRFALNFGLFVDIFPDGEIKLRDRTYFDSLNKEDMENALIELKGEEQANAIIMVGTFTIGHIESEFSQALENRLVEYYKPLGEKVSKKIKELELIIRNEKNY